jgi:hypothetical protein
MSEVTMGALDKLAVLDKFSALIREEVVLQTRVDLLRFVPKEPVELTPEEELEIWRRYGQDLSVHLLRGSSFSQKDGTANNVEQRRRWSLFSLFYLFKFRSEDSAIRGHFQRNFGSLSMKWFAQVVGDRAPTFYYEWAYQFLPSSKKVFGSQFIRLFLSSPDHLDVFKKIRPKMAKKIDLLMIQSVMED